MQSGKPPSGVVIMHVTSDLTGLKSYRASICGINIADTSSAGGLKQEGLGFADLPESVFR
jgi:hypothetical protein